MRYDHPSFLTRQLAAPFKTAAGANGTGTPGWVFPWDINIHTVQAVVSTAGTATGNKVFLLNGTASIASSDVTLSTNTAGVVGTSGDVAVKVTAGSVVYVKNGTDATGVAQVSFEYNIAPDTGTFVGNE